MNKNPYNLNKCLFNLNIGDVIVCEELSLFDPPTVINYDFIGYDYDKTYPIACIHGLRHTARAMVPGKIFKILRIIKKKKAVP